MPSSKKPLYPGPYNGREKTYYFTISGKSITEVVITAESLEEAYEKLADREWNYKDIKEATLEKIEEVEVSAN
ncbi:MAG: hypothetical protein J6S14_15205 [Clostridia bacterium]|nr:hypothetical protein [Clostridia bacterium]